MGGTTSKEAELLAALSKQDTRRLRACFSSSQYSPLHLLIPISQSFLDRVNEPSQTSDDHSAPPPYSEWLALSPSHVAAEQADTRILAEIISLVCGAPPAGAQLAETDRIPMEIIDPPDGNRWKVRDRIGLTPLSRAVRANNSQAVTLLLDAGANVDEVHSTAESDKHDPTLWSHARYCAGRGNPHILQILLERGADFVSWGKDGRRPVHHAVQAGHLECVKILIAQDNAKIDEENGLECEGPSSTEKRVRAISKYTVRECSITYPTEPVVEASSSASSTSAAEPSNDEDAVSADLPEHHRNILGALQLAIQDAVRGVSIGATQTTSNFRSNRDRGASLLHLACSHSRPDILSYLLSFPEFHNALEDMNDSGKTPIFMAVRHGSKHCLQLLIKAGANVASKDIENWTVLHEAVKAGDGSISTLQFLVDQCMLDSNAVDDDGWTALHVCARFSSPKAVDVLVKAGCDINAKTEDNETAVLLACAQPSSTEVLCRLLANGADLTIHLDTPLTPCLLVLGRRDFIQLTILLNHIKTLEHATRLQIFRLESQRTGDTLLHACVREGNFESIERLVDLGAPPNEKNQEGLAPIHIVCKNGNDEIARALLKGKTDLNLIRADGMTPLHIAADAGHPEVVRLLLEHDCDPNQTLSNSGRYHGFSSLMFAARLGNAAIVSLLLQAGADPNLQKGDGFTALHLAALNGNAQVCKSLLAGGSDYMLEDHTGYLPLQLATRHGQYEVVNGFIAANVAPDCCGKLGLTALHIASFMCDARIIWLLLRAGASTNMMNSENATPLHIAAGREQGRVSMQLLITNGAKLDLVDNEQETPLHKACYKGIYQNVRLLLRRGAAPSQVNKKNVTPLHLAAANGNEETVKALLRYGADVHAQDEDNRTPYAVASENNHRKVMILMFRAIAVALEDIAPRVIYHPDPSPSSSMRIFCVICQNSLLGGEETRRLPCSHLYHDHCILTWLGGEDLSRHESCPLCLRSVLPEVIPTRASSQPT
ncbi:unnamed protein product [Chondrus crispus]|uniref:RING-type domain-containing protein n=1 Tax=Chondrus crispus TaxID=2769 RepID=R7QMA0_CHOCR|nr:unnamed protein product [Chondrus crispus]CDF39229.1 unnamed protein product [Chondrus crispus]|eukprot:XP_005719140.1 unnamed protein product [Chondrus crispus]